jgi:magnesium chelatase family protein
MSLAVVHSRALVGLAAEAVAVEVHLAPGLPAFTIVGLADTEVKEARERVRAALLTCGLDFPSNRRITVNLAPADLPKDSGRFDLPIAVGILLAQGQLASADVDRHEFAGELSLSGALRPVRGALAMGLAARQAGGRRALVLPPGSAEEAALVADAAVWRAGHLLDVVRPLAVPGSGAASAGDAAGAAAGEGPDSAAGWCQVAPTPRPAPAAAPDLADVRGQSAGRRALEIAAAGGHSLLLVGPPGSGKSMLAQRLGGLLPPMTDEEALESAAIASLCGTFNLDRWGQRPTCSPHHSASAVALVGGGGAPRPGEISRAHHGVLFLDELPEFPRAALEALREPLESGRIDLVRAGRRASFPARFQLVGAMNPCPCGWRGHPQRACRCTPEAIDRYQSRLSGPLLDRIDLQVEVPAVPPAEILAAPAGEPTAVVQARCLAARERALRRQGTVNQRLEGERLQALARLDAEAQSCLQAVATRWAWSARATHRALRVARTIADLAGSEGITAAHVAEAVQYRRGLGG